MREYTVKVSLKDEGMRIDLFLLEFAKLHGLGFSRTSIQKLIAGGRITSLEGTGIKSNYKVKAGDEFKVTVEDKKPNGL